MKIAQGILLPLALLLGLIPVAMAEESGQVVSATALLQAPQRGAAQVAELKQGETVAILTRSGSWLKVRSAANQEGWVFMLDVRLRKTSWTRQASGFFGLFNRVNQQSSAAAMTVGIRGISEEDLQQAVPNYGALGLLEAHVANESQAYGFASQRNLSARQVNFLKAAP